MCGINAIYAYSEAAAGVDRAELLRTRDFMMKRGPDGEGAWFSADGRIGLGHRRLAIIDLSARAGQPMTTPDGRYVITYNGEIYNYQELRLELEREGVRFASASDTEVILQLYRLRGPAMLHKLRGMFAFCIWDDSRRSLFLARDPYGIKPLYYADDGRTVRVASRVKALIAGGVSRTLDPAGLASFFLRGHVMQPFTTFEAVRALPAGTHLTIDERGLPQPAEYFSVAATLREAVQQEVRLSDQERQEIVSDAVAESVRYHLTSDVPVGLFLSGGRDSTAVLAHATEFSDQLQTVTMRFEEFASSDDDESPVAELVARSYGTRHLSRTYAKEEFDLDLPKFLEAMDQPTVDAINSYIVSKAAAERGLKVILSGTGGDELFGGYASFRKVPQLVRRTALLSRLPLIPRLLRRVYATSVPAHWRFSPRSGGQLEYGGTYAGAYMLRRGLFMPWELPAIMGREAAEEALGRLRLVERIGAVIEPDPRTPFTRMVALESCLFMRDQLLPDIDWASMDHSLEVRVPLVDPFLLRKIAPAVLTATGDRKLLLARSPRRPLPPEVFERRKRGFTVPVREWLGPESRRAYGMRLWARRIYDWTVPGLIS